jgi:hypothetical protein
MDDEQPGGAWPGCRCARCGYDLRGAAGAIQGRIDRATTPEGQTWPLRGICSECGLDFDWGGLLRTEPLTLGWLYEHARGTGLGPRAWARAAATLWRALQPWRFWAMVSIELPVAPWRAAAWLVLVMLAAHMFNGLVSSACTWHVWLSPAWGRGNQGLSTLLSAWTEPFAEVQYTGFAVFARWHVQYWPKAVWAGMVAMSSYPLTLLLLTHTRATARVRPAHIVRAWVYSASWMVPVYACLGLFELERWLTGGRGITGSGSVVWWLVFRPNLVSVSAVLAWVNIAWYFAITRGLRLPRAGLVFSLLLLNALLSGAIVLLWFDESIQIALFG